MSEQTASVQCPCCKGSGRVELVDGVYRETLQKLRALGGEHTAADLGPAMGVPRTAMSNRLAHLERLGLATSRWYGRKRLYKATEGTGA